MELVSIETLDDGTVTKASFSGKMAASSDNTLFKNIFDENLEKDIKFFLLNFAGVNFINSSALGRIILDVKRVNEAGGKIAIYDLQKDILELFKITHLNKKVNIFDNESEALEFLKS
ncbi:MAG: STAS domain-containing protein [Nitrospinae bacterium]|nr:STAS domain-containing protein [Nitrospinota bacterium]